MAIADHATAAAEAAQADEAELIRRSVRGDRTAFGELYRRRARLVVALCYDATGRLDVAADLAQEVFLVAHRQLPRLRQPERFGPWLVTIARRTANQWRRSERRYAQHLDALRERQAQQVAVPQQHERLRDAIAMLPESERLALHSFYLEGRDANAVARLLSMSRASLYRLLAAARGRLQQLLQSLEVLQ